MTTPSQAAAGPGRTDFGEFFSLAYGEQAQPFAWQEALAEGDWPEVLIAPTGSGKTAAVTLAWAFHRLCDPGRTPRRLVWCLPMRTLVDQTSNEIRGWMARLDAALEPRGVLPRVEDVHVLMGGIDSSTWLEAPERSAVIVGTQDMLLSRALMRGYASSRAIWPMEFGLLHQDTQWVFDEVQLMGAGRATSAQLEAFRRQEASRSDRPDCPEGQPCRSLWISATLEPEWLRTVDHPAPQKVLRVDAGAENDGRLRRLATAPKHLQLFCGAPGSSVARDQKAYVARLAAAVLQAHRREGMTLVILNQVKRAQDLYAQLRRTLAVGADEAPELALLHSRFRQEDRARETARLLGCGRAADTIVITTQAVEAGVDVSAAVMFTELAPWASMVQRFGRANRWAEVEGGAQVHWIDLLASCDGDERQAQKLALPYQADQLRQARDVLQGLSDVASAYIPPPGEVDPPLRAIRRRDLDDLFDTDADLTGFDVDISPYVRDADDTDVPVFWRDLSAPVDAPPQPGAHELCTVPIGLARTWMKSAKKAVFFVRDPQWRRGAGQTGSTPPGWVPLREPPWPGLTVLADTEAGGYDEILGFTGNRKHIPKPVSPRRSSFLKGESEEHDDESRSVARRPVRLEDHLRHVVHEVSCLCQALGVADATSEVLVRAARWHDLGKAHEVFQATMRKGLDGNGVPEDVLLAKTTGRNLRHERAYFRHELASALAFLACAGWSRDADLGAFLIAAHHGKVRMNLRALPRESPPKDPELALARYARGIWEGDPLPSLDLGEAQRWQGGQLTLSIMELGWDETTRESWSERVRDLLMHHGPFELAWFETLLRLADWRASGKEESGGYDDA